MKEKILGFCKKYGIFIIIACVIILVIVLIISFRPHNNFTEEMLINEDLDEEEDLDPEEKQEDEDLRLGYEYYEKALEIYSIVPYCGIPYSKISRNRMIKENGVTYYKSDYSNVNDLTNKIGETLENPNISIPNTIKKNNSLYCKYVKPVKSNTYLNEYYLEIETSAENEIIFKVFSSYLKPNHSELCTIDTPLECTNEEKIYEQTKFVIVKNNEEWKVREFHMYH